MNDFKSAFRQLLKNSGITAVAVLTPALGGTMQAERGHPGRSGSRPIGVLRFPKPMPRSTAVTIQ